MKSITKSSALLTAVLLFAAFSASAVMVTWEGTNGVSATVNWSDPLNWYSINTANQTTPVANAANFTWLTAVQTPGLTTVNVDGAYTTPGAGFAQCYGAFFGQTNGYHTVVIEPGVIWSLQASGSTPSNGTQGIGILVGPQPTNNNTLATVNTVSTGATYTNYTTITGSTGTFYVDGGANGTSSQPGGLRVEAASTVPNNHYSILDMSGLGTFFMTNITGLSSHEGFDVVNGGQNSQGLVLLALTNTIYLNDNFQVGYLGISSNTLPIGVYLGQSNYISTGANNNAFVIGFTGCTNGFLKFNPNLLGGPSLPSVYITGASGNQAAQICNATGGQVPASASCDFTGGTVGWLGNTLKIGVSGSNAFNTSANGVLTFVNGTITFNTILIGSQTISGGATALGTVNIGTNATLIASNSITLGATVGTINPSTAGTINISSNGTLQASTITNGGAGSTINLTNANLSVAVSSTSVTNITVANFNAYGSSNTINITAIPVFLAGGFPARFHIVSTVNPANLVGASTFVLGTLPTSPNPSFPYMGHIDYTTTPGVVDFVLTSGPPSVRSLTWSGTNGSGPDGTWDVGVNADWLNSGVASVYNQLDLATFNDVTSPASTSVSLSTTLTPTSVTVSNNASSYTIGLSSDAGSIGGSTSFTKLGAGTLILDNAVSNSFSGGVLIGNGILQVGNYDANGNLPASGNITNNAVLAYGRTDTVIVSNTISGSGAVVSGGGGTLRLAGANSFGSYAVATNSSTLQSGSANAWGASSGTIVIANGSTYDGNGFSTARPIIVSGTGVNGNGAIVNSGVTIGDSGTGLSPSVTLAGDTTFSFPGRWDLGLPSGVDTLSTGGHPYNLTLNGTGNNTYFEWRDIAADPALANITVTAGYFGIVGSTTLGSTNYSLNVLAGAGAKFYNAGATNVVITKPLMVNDTSTIQNGGGSNTIAGPLIITNSGGNQYCEFDMNTPYILNVTGPVSGDGILWMQGSGVAGSLIINGNASAFTGGALIPAGFFTLNNVMGSGITTSAGTVLSGTGTANGLVDVSGAFFPGASNVAGTFTAAAGLTLETSSATTLNLTATTAEGGSNNSLVVVNGNLTLTGTPSLLINPVGTLANGTYTIMTYTGSLSGSFGSVLTVTNPSGYVPPSGYTYTLNTAVTGKVLLTVGNAPDPATFTAPFSLSGSTLTLGGSGGTPSGTYRVYSSTNLTAPFSQWTEITNGSFDGTGKFSFPTTVTNGPMRYYLLEEP